MPKRDEHYMERQRELIARAAIDCMMAKGVAATTLRDVSVQAGISLGAVYTHYKTRDDLVVAAFALFDALDVHDDPTPVDRWDAYVDVLKWPLPRIRADEDFRRRLRIIYEFAAEHMVEARYPAALSDRYAIAMRFHTGSLEAMRARGEIALPLGLRTTSLQHLQLQRGAAYHLLTDTRLDVGEVVEAFVASITYSAGLRRVS